jgi:hypothetical protein
VSVKVVYVADQVLSSPLEPAEGFVGADVELVLAYLNSSLPPGIPDQRVGVLNAPHLFSVSLGHNLYSLVETYSYL